MKNERMIEGRKVCEKGKENNAGKLNGTQREENKEKRVREVNYNKTGQHYHTIQNT